MSFHRRYVPTANFVSIQEPTESANAIIISGEQRRMATMFWSCQLILWNDETWLPEWSGKLAE